jgi:hypothetical protein
MTDRSAESVLLETERLVLRQFTLSDAGHLADLDADPDVMRFISGGLATSRDEIRDSLLPGFMAWYRRPGGFGCWAADQKSTGAFLGWFRFHPRRGGPSGEIVLGFRLRKPAWGQGYATEESRALDGHAVPGPGVRSQPGHDPGDPQPQGQPTLVSPEEAGLSRALDPTMYAGEDGGRVRNLVVRFMTLREDVAGGMGGTRAVG